MLCLCKSDVVVNAPVGFVGLRPSIETLRLGKRLALANKESLVVAGHLLDTSKITPIDSEHFWFMVSIKWQKRTRHDDYGEWRSVS